MKLTKFKVLVAGLILSTCLSVTACKSKPKETPSTEATPMTPAPEPAPVVISSDDSLKTKVADATKDFPTVKADVTNGEIILSGTITRSKNQNLMQSLSSLHAKKIDNQNLTIK